VSILTVVVEVGLVSAAQGRKISEPLSARSLGADFPPPALTEPSAGAQFSLTEGRVEEVLEPVAVGKLASRKSGLISCSFLHVA
jgi:hypothetical protein